MKRLWNRDLGSLLPLAVLFVPLLYAFDAPKVRLSPQVESEISAAFADQDRVITIDLREHARR